MFLQGWARQSGRRTPSPASPRPWPAPSASPRAKGTERDPGREAILFEMSMARDVG